MLDLTNMPRASIKCVGLKSIYKTEFLFELIKKILHITCIANVR